MAYWLLKTEPTEYSFADLVRDKRTSWDGVTNAQALIYLRQMAINDNVLIYHTGDEKRIVGIGQITAAPRDTILDSRKSVIIGVKAVEPLKTPVTLAAIKADPRFSQFALVRNSRLAAMPVADDVWQALMELAGM